MGNGLSTDQGYFTPHGLRDVDGTGAEQRQHDWSNPEDDNMLAGAPNNEEINSLSKFNTRHTLNVQSKTCDLHKISGKVAGCVVRTLKTFQGTHILGASRGLLCDSYAVL